MTSAEQLPGIAAEEIRLTMARRSPAVLTKIADNPKIRDNVRDAARLELRRREAAEQAREQRDDVPLEQLPSNERAALAANVRQLPTGDLQADASDWKTTQSTAEGIKEEVAVRQELSAWVTADQAEQIERRRDWVARQLPDQSSLPPYGSPEWSWLDEADPRKLAAAVAAAESAARQADPDVVAEQLAAEIAAGRDQEEAERAEWRRTQELVGPQIVHDAAGAARGGWTVEQRAAERAEAAEPRPGDYLGGPVAWEPSERIEAALDEAVAGEARKSERVDDRTAEQVTKASGGRLSRSRTDADADRRNYVEAGLRGMYATELANGADSGDLALAQLGQLGGGTGLHRSTVYAVTSHTTRDRTQTPVDRARAAVWDAATQHDAVGSTAVPRSRTASDDGHERER